MLNFVQLHDPSNLSLKVGAIIWNDLLSYAVPANDVILYESSHMLGFQYGVGGHFHPFGEIVNRH